MDDDSNLAMPHSSMGDAENGGIDMRIMYDELVNSVAYRALISALDRYRDEIRNEAMQFIIDDSERLQAELFIYATDKYKDIVTRYHHNLVG